MLETPGNSRHDRFPAAWWTAGKWLLTTIGAMCAVLPHTLGLAIVLLVLWVMSGGLFMVVTGRLPAPEHVISDCRRMFERD